MVRRLSMVAAVAAACFAGAAGAQDGGTSASTVFGILKVDSQRANTLVSVPWVACTGGVESAEICVADLVKTANLSEGDQLLAFNAQRGAYDGWTLAKGADGLLGWEPATTVSASGVTVAAGERDATLARGRAIWLVRQDASKPFYLQGQFEGAPAEVRVAGGSESAPAYTLLGNALREGVAVNDLDWGEGPAAGDTLSIPDGAVPRVLEWDAASGKWFRTVPTLENGRVQNVRTTTDRISAGAGFWYVRRAAAAFTFTWKKKGS